MLVFVKYAFYDIIKLVTNVHLRCKLLKIWRIRIAFIIIATIVTLLPIVSLYKEPVPAATPVEVETTTVAPPETTTEVLTEPGIKTYTLSVSTVQSDLRIKVLDDKKLVSNIAFKFEIVYPNGKKKNCTDDDKDGRLNLKKLENGTYKVSLVSTDAYQANRTVSIKVSDKVDYKPVKNILVDKNSKAEDKASHSGTKSGSKAKNTINYLESKKWSTYEYVKVSIEDVDAPVEEEPTTEGEETTTKSKSILKDKSGHELYVKSGSEYVKAYDVDFSTENTYYYRGKEIVHYQGWQEIDGKTYYFNKDGKKVTGSQVIGGGKYTFDSNGVLKSTIGIDVSKWQGTIDWAKVKKSGVSFAIIRLGYRGYGKSGAMNLDANFYKNLNGAKNAGLRVGVYFYSQATNEAEAIEEASFCLEALGGASINYPIFLDVENTGNNGRADKNSKATWTAVIKAFCKTINENSGYKVGVYANKDYLTNKISVGSLPSYCNIWLAHWTEKTNYSGRYNFWQYTDSGKVAGISGNVDMNFAYGI